jgi:quinol monooxygenase YgiN
MAELLIVVDASEVRAGKLEELKVAAKELVAFVEANEPRSISYNFYFSADGSRVTVVQVHPDSASMEFHMEKAASVFKGFADLVALERMDVYGRPSKHLIQLLQKKIELLGTATIAVHDHYAGIVRPPF